jgi:hypothetical protein
MTLARMLSIAISGAMTKMARIHIGFGRTK